MKKTYKTHLFIYPPEGDAQHIQEGSNCFYLYFIPEGRYVVYSQGSICFYLCFIWGQQIFRAFQKSIGLLNFFFASKCFIPRREIRSISLGVHLFLLMFYLGLVNLQSISKIYRFSQFFFLLQNVLSHQGRYVVSHQGSNSYSFHLLPY